MIDLNLLVVLDALLDERNVTRAAARLGYTQPTVSGMLSRLRDLFGDPLFVRTQRGLLPTPRAQALAVPLKQLLADSQRLVAREVFDPASGRGDLHHFEQRLHAAHSSRPVRKGAEERGETDQIGDSPSCSAGSGRRTSTT